MTTHTLPVPRNLAPRRPGAQLALNVLKLSPVAAAVIALLSPAWLYAQSDVQEARLALLRQSQVLVNTAASVVALRARDSDNDGTLEPPAMVMVAGAGPTGGGLLPSGVAIQQTDGYGTALGYCAWDQGSATSLPGRIAGSSSGAILLAVISAGPDRVFNTTCAVVLTSGGKGSGDDVVGLRDLNQTMLTGGVSFARPPVLQVSQLAQLVTDRNTALAAAMTAGTEVLDPLTPGEMRMVTADNSIWRFDPNGGTVITSGALAPAKTGAFVPVTAGAVGAGGSTSFAGDVAVGGALGVTGLTTLSGGLTAVGPISLNATGSAATLIGNAASTTTIAGPLTLSGLPLSASAAGKDVVIVDPVTGAVSRVDSAAFLSSAGGVSGSGTTNYLAKFTPAGASLGNSQVFDNGTGVGVGTVLPGALLDVNGSFRAVGNVTLSSLSGAAANPMLPIGFDRFVVANPSGTLSQVSAAGVISNSAWSLIGNSYINSAGALGAAPTGTFLGSTNNAAGNDIRLVTGNVVRAIVSQAGQLSVQQDMLVNGVTVGRGGGNVADNTALGAGALAGGGRNWNTAVGGGTLSVSNSTGDGNTALGYGALGTLSTGVFNVALGFVAGGYVGADGSQPLISATGSVFVGSGARPLADGQTNQIAIGGSSVGLGSNSAILGNDSITATRLQGRVGIGINPTGATGVNGLFVRAGASQSTNNLVEAQNAAGTALFSVGSAGNTAVAGTLGVSGLFTATGGANISGATVLNTTGSAGTLIGNASSTTAIAGPVTLSGIASTTTPGDDVLVITSPGNVVQRISRSSFIGSAGWALTGNTGTSPATNFLGTTDAQPLVMRTNNLERLRVLAGGNVGIGTSTPTQRLHLSGGNLLIDPVSAGTAGQLQLRNPAGTFQTNLRAGAQTADITYTLPTTAPTAGQVLSSDASGNLSWVASGSAASWSLTGNAGTSPATNFLGTTDAQDLIVRTNSGERMRFTSGGSVYTTGSLGVGTVPSQALQVAGSAYFSGEDSVLVVDAAGSSRLGIVKAAYSTPVYAAASNTELQFGHWSTTSLLGNIATGTFTERLAIDTAGRIKVANLGGTAATAMPTGYDRILLANNSGLVDEVSISTLLAGQAGSLSSLTAATATNTINNGGNAQTWQWNSLGGATALTLSTASTTAASNLQTVFGIELTGTNANASQTTYGMQVSNGHAGSQSTNIAGYFKSQNGTRNYALITDGGLVGIGATAPTAQFQVHVPQATVVGSILRAAASQSANLAEWQSNSGALLASVGSSGALTLNPFGAAAGNTNEMRFAELAANGTNYVGFKAPDLINADRIWTLPAADGSSGQVLTTNGAGALSWTTVSGSTGWSLTGNTFTNSAGGLGAAPSGTFIGSTNNAAGNELRLVTSNVVRAIVAQTGQISTQLDMLVNTNVTVGRGGSSVASNTALGASALLANTSGSSNVAMGNLALTANTTGGENVAVGPGALAANAGGNRNTAVGVLALQAATASNNTAVGYRALYVTTTGSFNVAYGYDALGANTAGSQNTGIGYGTLTGTTTGVGNVALGYQAGNAAGSGDNRLFIANNNSTTLLYGEFAAGRTIINTSGLPGALSAALQVNIRNNTDNGLLVRMANGQVNSTLPFEIENNAGGTIASIDTLGDAFLGGVRVGRGGGYVTSNTILGAGTLLVNTSGYGNVAVGSQALTANTTGADNTAVGSGALMANVVGNRNIAVGGLALTAATASNNIATGYRALRVTTTGENNVAYGNDALGSNTTGYQNTAIGHSAMGTNITGFGNIALGYQAGGGANSVSNRLFIANNLSTTFLYGELDTGRAMINTTGTGVALSAALQVNLRNNTDDGLVVRMANGQVGASNPFEIQDIFGNTIAAIDTLGDAFLGGVRVGRGGSYVATNTTVGFQTLLANTSGNANAALGYQALTANTTGTDNTALGSLALTANVTGIRNIAVGSQALTAATASNNTAVGHRALRFTTTGANNVAYGYEALVNNTTGQQNTAIGYLALGGNATGAGNVALGYGAGGSAASPSNRLFVANAGSSNLIYGEFDTGRTMINAVAAPGALTAALQVNVFAAADRGLVVRGAASQSGNTLEVQSSGGTALFTVNNAGNLTRVNNIGYSWPGSQGTAGTVLTNDGSGNLTWAAAGGGTLWALAGNSLPTPVNATPVLGAATTGYGSFIGSTNAEELTFATSNVIRGYFRSNGGFIVQANVGIGVTNPAYALEVSGDINAQGLVRSNGTVLSSDVRFKTNIAGITGAMATLERLQGVRYDWNRAAFPERGFTQKRQLGVIAQQVESVLPELVDTDAQGFKSVNYIGLVPLLIEAAKEQQLTLRRQDGLLQQQAETLLVHAQTLDAHGGRLTTVEDRIGKAETRLIAVSDRTGKIELRAGQTDELIARLTERADGADGFVARFDTSVEGTVAVRAPTFKVNNLTAERAEVEELIARRIQAEEAKFKTIEAEDGQMTGKLQAKSVSAQKVASGGKELFVSLGAIAPLFDVPEGAHFVVTLTSSDGSYASATVVRAGGQLRVMPTASEGIDLVAQGTQVGVVAGSKKVKASWLRTG